MILPEVTSDKGIRKGSDDIDARKQGIRNLAYLKGLVKDTVAK